MSVSNMAEYTKESELKQLEALRGEIEAHYAGAVRAVDRSFGDMCLTI
ncbi:MAG: hypothetical protein HY770_01855, partial [Chitinivibrionia bacterium]|nr:hypothetical protein [Chitinivibrionia bacterium]